MPKVIVQHQGQESTVELKQGSNVVGRQSTCDIPIKEVQLSRQHCDLVLAGSTLIVVDKGSMNGTLVNGKRIAGEQVLKAGDKVVVGPVVLWVERKNVGDPVDPPSRPAPPSREESPSSGLATRRAVASDAAAPLPAGLPRDYAVRVRVGGAGVAVASTVAVVAALVVLGWLAKSWLTRPPAQPEDRGGLVKDGGFDQAAGRASGWSLPDKSASSASVDPRQGRNGGGCLVVDKAGAASDRQLACMYGQDLVVGPGSGVQAEAQVRFESFAGSAALKVDWLREPRGPVVAEEYGDAVSGAGSWTALSARFTPPPGAGGFRIGLALLGRGGRALVDDVSVKTFPGGGPARDYKIAGHTVRPTGQGVLQVALPRQAFFDIQAQLESDKDGAVRQAAALQVSTTSTDGRLEFAGKLPSPVDFGEIPYEQVVSAAGGGTAIAYTFRGENLRQIDRFAVALTLPRGTGVPDPEAATQPRSRMSFRTPDGPFVLEYSEPVRITARALPDGRHRIVQIFPFDAQQEVVEFGLRIREESAAGESDPQRAAGKAKEARRLGEALSILRNFLPGIKEAPLREKIEREIRGLEEGEARDWVEVQAAAFRAGLLKRPEVIARARDQAETYLREWAGVAPYETKGAQLRGEVARIAPRSDDQVERPRRLLEQAKVLVQAGKTATAGVLLETLVARYPESDAATAARDVLKSLSP